MEPVFLNAEQYVSEGYQYDPYSTYGNSMCYSNDPVQYSAAQPYTQPGYSNQYQNLTGVDLNQLLYSEDSSQDAVILLATDQQSGSYESVSSGVFDASDVGNTVKSFRTESELLDYFSTLGDLKDIQILPITSEMSNTEKYTDETKTEVIGNKQTEPVLPVQPAKRKRTTALKSGRRPRTVYENSSFVCEPCDRTFGRRSGLIQHNNVHHSGPRAHRCQECGKRFHTPVDLQRHIERHVTQHKPHKCVHCPRQFNYHQDLERHIAVRHGGVTKYECRHCGKRFARRDHLLSHEASHVKKEAREARRNRFQELVEQLQLGSE